MRVKSYFLSVPDPHIAVLFLRETFVNQEVTEFSRLNNVQGWIVGPGETDAIGCKVSTEAKLAGLGMFGVQEMSFF